MAAFLVHREQKGKFSLFALYIANQNKIRTLKIIIEKYVLRNESA